MILDLDALLPDHLSDETVTAVAELLNELANQWESHCFHRLRAYQAKQQVDLFHAEEPWHQTGSG
jgi:hypothetical protein